MAVQFNREFACKAKLQVYTSELPVICGERMISNVPGRL